MVSNERSRVRGFKAGLLLKCGVSATALCVIGTALPAAAQSAAGQAQSADPTQTNGAGQATGANQSSPTGSASGPGTAGAATTTSSQESGQDAPTEAPNAGVNGADDVVVTGIRQSLANAQNIKRNSDTIVDAITATDIGALPDRSVSEALRRVPGVEVSQFAAGNDPDHFSTEGAGVTVRGLNFVRSEFNGRDAFAAGIGGQSLDFAAVPAELLGSVEVYKNATASAIEGGLAGTVNLNTRKPFDNKGLHIGVDAEANYADFVDKWSPTGSILASDTWNTGIGTFGLLGDVSYSEVRSRADGIQVTNFQTRDNTQVPYQNGNGVLICRNPLPSNSDTTKLPAANAPCGTASTAGADGFADPASVEYAPLGAGYRSQTYDDKRQGVAAAAQYQTNDGSFLLTGQFIHSHYTNAWGEHTFEASPDLSEYDTFPNGCVQNTDGPLYNGNGTTRAECPVGKFQNYTYNGAGLFESGYITQPGTGYRTNKSGTAADQFPTGGDQFQESERQVYERSINNDYGLNAVIKPSSRLLINLDADYTTSVHTESDVSILGSTFADQELNLTGNLPQVTTHKPSTLAAAWATPNPTLVSETDAQYFADPNRSFYRAAQEHFEDSRGREYQVAGNFTYNLGDEGGFIDQIKFGARYADRDQTVKYSAYNWGNLSEVWAGYPVSVAQAGLSNSTSFNFPNFFRGEIQGPPPGYYWNGNLLDTASYQSFVNSVEKLAQGNGATNQQFQFSAARPGAIAGTPYLPSEVSDIKEQDTEAYVELPFKTDNLFGHTRVSGNIGVRYVSTDIVSTSASAIPTLQTLGIASQTNPAVAQPYGDVLGANGAVVTKGRCDPQPAPAGAPSSLATIPGGVCNLGPAGYAQLVAFAATTPTFTPTLARNDYNYFLPSFNLKVSATDTLLFRLAASKVITRPDTSLIRPYVTIGLDGNGNFTATAGNPYLKPASAWQFDATAEWYFSRVGSLTVDAFYKDVKDFFYSTLINSPVVNNGITFNQLVRGAANYSGDGKIKGVEVGYQQQFTFLPSLLSGFGFTGNYSFIDSSGLPNSFLNGGTAVTNINAATQTGKLPLEGLSKHNVNATIYYEKGPVSIRAAYNWRSKYLLTAADVIYPYSSIFQGASGSLDASAFVNINKYIKIGVQGVNLTNTVVETLQAYTGDPNQLAPRSYFMQDRRYAFILRGTF